MSGRASSDPLLVPLHLPSRGPGGEGAGNDMAGDFRLLPHLPWRAVKARPGLIVLSIMIPVIFVAVIGLLVLLLTAPL